MKLSPLRLKQLLSIVAMDYGMSPHPNYFGGQELVDIFVECGFEDDYDYANKGCPFRLADKYEPRSRKDYVKHNLNILNSQDRIECIVEPLMFLAGDKDQMKHNLEGVLSAKTIVTPQASTSITMDIIQSTTPESPTWPFSTNDNHKRVFISYSWDSEQHKSWVLQLCNDLRRKGLEVVVDIAQRKGVDLIDFMDKGIANAHKVLLIGTPMYKQKSEEIKGGVKYENTIIKATILHGAARNKYIPVLRSGTFETSFPDVISVLGGYVMCDDVNYSAILDDIVCEVYDHPKQKLAPLAPVPLFYEDTQPDLFRSVYIPYFDTIFNLYDVPSYKDWAYGLAVSGDTMIAVRRYEQLVELREYLLSRVAHKGYEVFDKYLTSLGILLSDIVYVLSLHLVKWGENMYAVDKFYKRHAYNEDTHQEERNYIDLVCLIGDLVLEQTRLLNSLLSCIRKKKPDYMLDEGVLGIYECTYNLKTMPETSPFYDGLENFILSRPNRRGDFYETKQPNEFLLSLVREYKVVNGLDKV